jgi:hypothetical protein
MYLQCDECAKEILKTKSVINVTVAIFPYILEVLLMACL